MSTSQVPTRVLPLHPSEEHLRKEAKRLARDAGIQLAAAQRQLAHEYGYANWTELVGVVQRMSSSGGGNGGRDGDPARQAPPPTTESSGDRLPVLPLRGLVAFPHVSYPVFVGRRRSINAVERAYERKLPVILVAQKDQNETEISSADLYDVGVTSEILQLLRLPDGTLKTVMEAKQRVQVSGFDSKESSYSALAKAIEETPVDDPGVRELVNSVVNAFVGRRVKTVADAVSQPELLSVAVTSTDGASVIADRIASELKMGIALKQTLLEIADPAVRLEKLLVYLGI